jgi:hypothetical protein
VGAGWVHTQSGRNLVQRSGRTKDREGVARVSHLSGSMPAMRRLGSWAIFSTVCHCSAFALELGVRDAKEMGGR